jgi:hypothetical protein
MPNIRAFRILRRLTFLKSDRSNFGSSTVSLREGVTDRNTRKNFLYFRVVDHYRAVDDDIGDAGRRFGRVFLLPVELTKALDDLVIRTNGGMHSTGRIGRFDRPDVTQPHEPRGHPEMRVRLDEPGHDDLVFQTVVDGVIVTRQPGLHRFQGAGRQDLAIQHSDGIGFRTTRVHGVNLPGRVDRYRGALRF